MSLAIPVKINLFWDTFLGGDENRQEEIIQTFVVNVNNPLFDRIYCYFSKRYSNSIRNNPVFELLKLEFPEKIIEVEIDTIHTEYADLFRLANIYSGDYDINIISNNDIIFGNWDREKINKYLRPKSFFCLSRLQILEKINPDLRTIEEIIANTKIQEFLNNDQSNRSQDIWIWRGIMQPIFGFFPKGGTWGCDEVISYESFKNGYFPSNPSLLFRCYHNHLYSPNNWPSSHNRNRHLYTPNQVRCNLIPYDPDTLNIPHPILSFFDFSLPVYTPHLI